ncbi:hypothetical protein U1Q18_021033 [Sarracenia purpurea var. burkii]
MEGVLIRHFKNKSNGRLKNYYLMKNEIDQDRERSEGVLIRHFKSSFQSDPAILRHLLPRITAHNAPRVSLSLNAQSSVRVYMDGSTHSTSRVQSNLRDNS